MKQEVKCCWAESTETSENNEIFEHSASKAAL
ncbi:hypothetical protein T03_2092 [Trichinella britovi]|uniref:Uncharacterized protein n=1 Tax=Trichinella britovi TaxID=45882 RepID=A0A0V1AGU8_TRIBR|nr:hypothetical protein T03_2092 [Trichinella britovi]